MLAVAPTKATSKSPVSVVVTDDEVVVAALGVLSFFTITSMTVPSPVTPMMRTPLDQACALP